MPHHKPPNEGPFFSFSKLTGIDAGVPVILAGGDQQNAAVALGVLKAGRAEANTGTGFSFANYNAHEMLDTIKRAEEVYYEDKEAWNGLVERAMTADFSWNNSARQYEAMYDSL